MEKQEQAAVDEDLIKISDAQDSMKNHRYALSIKMNITTFVDNPDGGDQKNQSILENMKEEEGPSPRQAAGEKSDWKAAGENMEPEIETNKQTKQNDDADNIRTMRVPQEKSRPVHRTTYEEYKLTENEEKKEKAVGKEAEIEDNEIEIEMEVEKEEGIHIIMMRMKRL